MRVLLALCLISSALFGAPSAWSAEDVIERPISDKWALVVGISKFQSPKCEPLRYSAKDATSFRDFLVKKAHFAPDHVKLLTDEQATRERIISELGSSWLPHKAISDDLVVIFFSTHGSGSEFDEKGLNYLIAHNTDPGELLATGIPLQDISNLIKNRVNSKRVVLILDACHSGAASTGAKGILRTSNFDAEQLAQGTGQIVICSSQPSQTSWESRNYENSVFTHHLIEALGAEGPSTRLADAFERARKNVELEVVRDRGQAQTPVMKMHWEGTGLKLCAPPAEPRSADGESYLTKAAAARKQQEQRQTTARQEQQSTIAYMPPPPVVSTPPAVPPSYSQPTYSQPAYSQPTYSQPTYSQPTYSPPTYSAPATNDPVRMTLPDKACVIPCPYVRKAEVDGWNTNLQSLNVPHLQVLFANNLYKLMGKRVTCATKLNQPANYQNVAGVPRDDWMRLGRELQSKYLIVPVIEEVRLKGKVMTGNTYKLVCSVALVAAETGEVLWQARDIKVSETSWVKDQVKGMTAFFQENIMPDMAAKMTDHTAVVLKQYGF